MNDTLLANAVRVHKAGELQEAARLYTAILRASPRHFQALYLLGFVHSQRGQFGEAERLIGEALKVNPHSPDAHYNRGCALQRLQRQREALEEFDAALRLKPDYADAAINRGVVLLALKCPGEAVASFDKGLAISPRDAEGLGNRGTALFRLKRYEEAARTFETLLAATPDFADARGNLALCRAYCCDWRAVAEERARLHADARAGKRSLSPHAATLISDDPEDQLRFARIWAAEKCPPSPAPLWRGERYRHERIRVAYLSADFHAHATAYLTAGLFEEHNRARFEVTAVSFGPDDQSEMRARLIRAFDRFIDVSGKSDADVAHALRRMEVDIAVDLKGFTDDARPGILAFRPCPIQVNYLGHPGTMGAAHIDYLIADRIVAPDTDRAQFSEKIVWLPGSYQANDAKRHIASRTPSRAEAGLPETGFVFASFNNTYKIIPEVFDVWMRLLKATGGSVLWLLDDNEAAVRNLKREAEQKGVPKTRLVFAPRMVLEEHLARQRLADLFLDTLPCNAHTTASDALWAGLPVLTCLGTTFAGRVAPSLLNAVGLPQLVTRSLDEYEALALKLANDPPALASIKTRLVQNRNAHPLFDTKRFTRRLETAYATMCTRQRSGLGPEDFAVAP